MPLAGNHQIYSETYSIADFLINDSYSNILWKVKKNIWQTHNYNLFGKPIFQRRFGRVTWFHFQVLMIKKLRYKYYKKRITTRDNGNVQPHDQKESKLNDTINANSGGHALTYDKIIKIHSTRTT